MEDKLKGIESVSEVLAQELLRAFKSVGCDLRCFDWLCYTPDTFIQQHRMKEKI